MRRFCAVARHNAPIKDVLQQTLLLRQQRLPHHQILLWSAQCIQTRCIVTSGDEELLDHSLRQILASGPVWIPQIMRKLPDEALDILEETNQGLAGYLASKNRKFLIRRLPDGRCAASLSALEAATLYRSEARKVIIAAVDEISGSSHAHLTGGVAIQDLETSMARSLLKRAQSISGTLMAFLCSYPDVFDVSVDTGRVRLVDKQTPLPRELLLTSATAAAAGPTSSASQLPTTSPSSPPPPPPPPAPPRNTSLSSTSSRMSHKNYAAATSREDSVAQDVIRCLDPVLPFSTFVSLTDLIRNVPGMRERLSLIVGVQDPEVRDIATDVTAEQEQALSSRLVQVLSQYVPSAVIDCRVIGDNSSSTEECYLRLVGEDYCRRHPRVDRSSVSYSDEEEGRGGGGRVLQKRLVTSQLAAEIVDAVGEAYLGLFTHEIKTQWQGHLKKVSASLKSDEDKAKANQQECLFSNEATIAASVDHLPSFSMDVFHTRIFVVQGACDGASSGVTPTNNSSTTAGSTSSSSSSALSSPKRGGVRLLPFAGNATILLFDRLQQLFEVNFELAEVRMRREVFLAWMWIKQQQQEASEGQRRPHPPPAVSLILDVIDANPTLKAMRCTTLDFSSSPIPNTLRFINQLLMQPPHQGQPLSAVHLPPHVMSEVCAMMSGGGNDVLQRVVAYHSNILMLRDEHGRLLSTDRNNGAPSSSSHYLWNLPTLAAYQQSVKSPTPNSAGYGDTRSWSDDTLAQAVYDTLPQGSDEVVVWSHHMTNLAQQYSDVVPVDVVRNKIGFDRAFFQRYAHLFDTFEMMVNVPSSFLIGRRGVAPAPLCTHPLPTSTPISLGEALKQVAIICAGGAQEAAVYTSLSSEARQLLKKYGGVCRVTSQLPRWFEVRGSLVTYIGADMEQDVEGKQRERFAALFAGTFSGESGGGESNSRAKRQDGGGSRRH